MTSKEEKLETLLYNAIISWYDDSLIEYHGLDDEKFINKVCESIGIDEDEYKHLMI